MRCFLSCGQGGAKASTASAPRLSCVQQGHPLPHCYQTRDSGYHLRCTPCLLTCPQVPCQTQKSPTMLKSESNWNLVPLPASSTKGGERGVLKALGLNQQEGQLFSYSILHQTNHKLVNSPLETPLVLGQAMGNTDSLDSPRPGLGGSHHLPPYSILCVAPLHLHPNDFYSRDSQGGVPKLSWFGLPGFWELITLSSDL